MAKNSSSSCPTPTATPGATREICGNCLDDDGDGRVDLRDPDGFLREARRARAFGCIGKSCIHPSQVALANAVFAPDAGEIAAAAEVVKAVAGASADGHGAFVVAGRMIDAPYLRRAEAVLAQARRLGLLAREGEEAA